MTLYVRGANPIWSMVDLTGHQFDDTFYMFVLENTIPYIPATVYHTPSGIPWNEPIQFLANGTLPVDIYWDPDVVYRLEFRKGNTQADPLIYLVENYMPCCAGGVTPIDASAVVTDNQITNPQFSLVSFSSPYTLTGATNPDPIEVAPGWFLVLTGSGNLGLEQVPLTSTLANPTNAPYALRITLSGSWSGAYLRQRFNQNGMLWSTFTQPRYVSNSVTARIEGALQNISAQLYDSMGTALTTVLSSTALSNTFNEYIGHGLMPETSNTNTPPNAWIEYRLALPTNVDVYLTSFQLVNSHSITNFEYIQDSIERQVDYTFHYYRDSILLQPKESILTGWDFGLNPWQSRSTTLSTFNTFGYTADQTFVVQQKYVESSTVDNVQVGQSSAATNQGFLVQALTATNVFAIGQYIDPSTVRPFWGSTLSTLVKLNARRQNTGVPLRVKMRLIWRTSLPSALARLEPIATWVSGSDPVFAAGWTAIVPKNDPVYDLDNGANTLTFEGLVLPASSNADMTLGIIIYTIDPMIQTGTADNINFNRASLVPNLFAIDSNVLTYDETLRQCEFYYEKSYNNSVLPGTVPAAAGELIRQQRVTATNVFAGAFDIEFSTVKRSTSCQVDLYSPSVAGTVNVVLAVAYMNGAAATQAVVAAAGTNWTENASFGQKGRSYTALSNTVLTTGANEGFIAFHYTANARLGL